jgi:hypothetical protein
MYAVKQTRDSLRMHAIKEERCVRELVNMHVRVRVLGEGT